MAAPIGARAEPAGHAAFPGAAANRIPPGPRTIAPPGIDGGGSAGEAEEPSYVPLDDDVRLVRMDQDP
jgi:hypothetical protein